MNGTRLVLWALAVVFVAFGVVALIQPSAMTGPPGLDASAAGAVTEVRALYGGLQLGLGAFLIDGNWTGFHLFALGFEWTTALVALFLWWRLRQSGANTQAVTA